MDCYLLFHFLNNFIDSYIKEEFCLILFWNLNNWLTILSTGCTFNKSSGHIATHDSRWRNASKRNSGVENVMVWIKAKFREGSEVFDNSSIKLTHNVVDIAGVCCRNLCDNEHELFWQIDQVSTVVGSWYKRCSYWGNSVYFFISLTNPVFSSWLLDCFIYESVLTR